MTERPSRSGLLAAWAPALVWMAAIFYLSHQSDVSIPFGAPDYGAHAAGYAGLGALIARALARGRLVDVTWPLVGLAIVLSALYGVSDEFHQSFIPGRHPSLSDILADTVGAAVGAAAAAVAGQALRRRRAHPLY